MQKTSELVLLACSSLLQVHLLLLLHRQKINMEGFFA
jgi:hypothetical protein